MSEVSEGICTAGYLSRVERGERTPKPALLAELVARLESADAASGVAPARVRLDDAERPGLSAASLEWAAADAVACAADHWLAFPEDRKAYGRLVDSVESWRRATRAAELARAENYGAMQPAGAPESEPN